MTTPSEDIRPEPQRVEPGDWRRAAAASASRYAATALGGPIDLAAAILDDTRDLVGVRAACAGRHALFEPSPVTEPRDEREFRRSRRSRPYPPAPRHHPQEHTMTFNFDSDRATVRATAIAEAVAGRDWPAAVRHIRAAITEGDDSVLELTLVLALLHVNATDEVQALAARLGDPTAEFSAAEVLRDRAFAALDLTAAEDAPDGD